MLYKLKIKLDEAPKQEHDIISISNDGKIECYVKFKTKRLLNNFLIKHKVDKNKLYIHNNGENEKLLFLK